MDIAKKIDPIAVKMCACARTAETLGVTLADVWIAVGIDSEEEACMLWFAGGRREAVLAAWAKFCTTPTEFRKVYGLIEHCEDSANRESLKYSILAAWDTTVLFTALQCDNVETLQRLFKEAPSEGACAARKSIMCALANIKLKEVEVEAASR